MPHSFNEKLNYRPKKTDTRINPQREKKMGNLPILTGLALGGLACGLLISHQNRKKATAPVKVSPTKKKQRASA